MKFSEKIKEFRMQNNLTQQEFADKLFVSRSAVAKWEQDRGMPSLDLLEKISAVLNVSIDDLVGEKEYRSMTLESNVKVKKYEKYNKIILGIGCVFFVAIVCLFILLFNNKDRQRYSYEVFGVATVQEECVEVLCKDYDYGLFYGKQTVSIPKTDLENIDVYDKYGKLLENKDFRTGYRLCVEFSSPHTKGMKDIQIEKIHIIDDYVEGDYYVYGFFISTEKYEGDEAPIYETNFDFSTFSHIAYEENNIQYGLTYRYPFYLEKWSGKSKSGNIVQEDCIDVAYSAFVSYDYVIAKEREFSIKVSDRIQTVYVYAVDNSEKRYTFVKEVTKDDNRAVISDGAVKQEYLADYKKPVKIDMTYCINVNFEKAISYVEVSEYNKNHETLYTSVYHTYEEMEVHFKAMTEDSMRYVRVYYHWEDGSSLPINTYVAGDYLEISLENKYGFMFTKQVRLY